MYFHLEQMLASGERSPDQMNEKLFLKTADSYHRYSGQSREEAGLLLGDTRIGIMCWKQLID